LGRSARPPLTTYAAIKRLPRRLHQRGPGYSRRLPRGSLMPRYALEYRYWGTPRQTSPTSSGVTCLPTRHRDPWFPPLRR